MIWALGLSLVANGFLVGAYVGIYLAQRHQSEDPVEGDVPGGGIAQDPDTDYVWDTTVTAKVVGFKVTSGE